MFEKTHHGDLERSHHKFYVAICYHSEFGLGQTSNLLVSIEIVVLITYTPIWTNQAQEEAILW